MEAFVECLIFCGFCAQSCGPHCCAVFGEYCQKQYCNDCKSRTTNETSKHDINYFIICIKLFKRDLGQPMDSHTVLQ